MSVEVCQECGAQVDTDYNVEGEVVIGIGFVCQDCFEEMHEILGDYDE